MDSKVHPLVVILVMLLTTLSIGVWVWGSGQAKEIGGPAGLHIDPRGHLFIQIQDKLLEHDSNGIFLQRYDLARIGADQVFGNIAFFSNGDVLVRRGPDPRTFGDNLRAYQRKTNEHSLEQLTPDTGLYRCDLQFIACSVFGSPAIDFKAANSLFIDWQTDEVYVSDTSRHVLRKYSSTGETLGGPVAGFKFPNELLLHEGQLFVADTNHHRVRVVDPRTETFGEELISIDVVPRDASSNRQIWPSHIARVGNQWWVNNMRSGMNEGGIYIFDDTWRFEHMVSLPGRADPIAIMAFRDEVLISDWNNDKIYRISKSGEMLRDFTSAGFEQVLVETSKARLQFQMYSYGGVALFLLTIAGLFVRGLASNMSAETVKKRTVRPDRKNGTPDEILWIEPDARNVRKIEVGVRIGIALLVVVDLSLTVVVLYYANLQVTLQLLVPLVILSAIFFPIARISLKNIKTAIGVRRDKVVLRDYAGRESTCPMSDVLYDYTAIATQDMAAFFGKPQMPIYDPQILKDQLFPRLANAQRVSIWAMQKRLHRIRHPHGAMGVVLLVVLLMGSLALLAWYASGQ